MPKKKTQTWIPINKTEAVPVNRAARRAYFKMTGKYLPPSIMPIRKPKT